MNKSFSDAILFHFRLEKSDTGPATGREQVRYPVSRILQVESLGQDQRKKVGKLNERSFRWYKTSFVDKDSEFDPDLIGIVGPEPGAW